jgi:hypothetical protein
MILCPFNIVQRHPASVMAWPHWPSFTRFALFRQERTLPSPFTPLQYWATSCLQVAVNDDWAARRCLIEAVTLASVAVQVGETFVACVSRQFWMRPFPRFRPLQNFLMSDPQSLASALTASAKLIVSARLLETQERKMRSAAPAKAVNLLVMAKSDPGNMVDFILGQAAVSARADLWAKIGASSIVLWGSSDGIGSSSFGAAHQQKRRIQRQLPLRRCFSE